MKRNILFVTLNILTTIIEYVIIFTLLYIKQSLLLSILITISILLLHGLLSYYIYIKPLKVKPSDEEQAYNDLLNPLLKQYEKDTNQPVKIKYVSINARPNPAWCLGRELYINTAYAKRDDLLLGICSHELGHLYSGLTKHIFWFSLRPSSIISMLIASSLRLLIYGCSQKKNQWLIIFFYPIYIIFILFSIFNLFIVYPFLRQDEHLANNYAIKLGFGKSILKYYIENEYYRKEDDHYNYYHYIDFEHPSLQKMINEMIITYQEPALNQGFLINEQQLLLYFKDEINIIIPESVKQIKANAFLCNHEIEYIEAPNVLLCENGCFNYLDNLHTLVLPKVEQLPNNLFMVCPKLSLIKVDNEKGYISLGTTYERVNKFKEVITYYNEGLTKGFNNLIYPLALIYEKVELDKAINIYQALLINNDYQAFKRLIYIYNNLLPNDNILFNLLVDYEFLIKETDNLLFYQLGCFYYKGIITVKDDEKALYFLIKARSIKDAEDIIKLIKENT